MNELKAPPRQKKGRRTSLKEVAEDRDEPSTSGAAELASNCQSRGREIDDIFSKIKGVSDNRQRFKEPGSLCDGKQTTATRASTGAGEGAPGKEKKRKKEADGARGLEGETGKRKEPQTSTSRKKTAEGFAVYKEEELGFNAKSAGGTDLCPFDCKCCF